MTIVKILNTAWLSIRCKELLDEEGLSELGLKPRERRRVPVLTYLFETDRRSVLIDSGLDASPFLTPLADRIKYRPLILLDWFESVPARKLHLAVTHSHFDHTGNVSRFRLESVTIRDREWDTASGHFRRNVATAGAFRALAKEEFHKGVYPFPSADLYGDGSLVALKTPGHTAGHTAYLAKLEGRSLLFAGDLFEGYEGLRYPPLQAAEDPNAYARTLETLKGWLRDDPGLLLLPSHEPEIAAFEGRLDADFLMELQILRLRRNGIL